MPRVDFPKHLRRQLRFIENSAARFDYDCFDEAIRIATAVRVIVHQTKSSTSLLTHLNASRVMLLDTAGPAPKGAQHWDGLSAFTLYGPRAKLDGSGGQTSGYVISNIRSGDRNLASSHSTPPRRIPVMDWWNNIIYINNGVASSRKGLVLGAANKDGGAHVDAALDKPYESLATNFWMTHDGTKERPLDFIHLIGLRQIAYEILNSPDLCAIASPSVAP